MRQNRDFHDGGFLPSNTRGRELFTVIVHFIRACFLVSCLLSGRQFGDND